MKHIFNKSTYFLFSVIDPIIYLLTCKFAGTGIKDYLFPTGCFELFIWFIFLKDYDWFPKHLEKESKND